MCTEKKNIRELTEVEAKQILKYVYPDIDKKYGFFKSLSFDPHKTEDGERITFGGRSIVGIEYHNGQDNCILHFDNTKVVKWLYDNGYDISEQLHINESMTEMEHDFDEFAYGVEYLMKNVTKLRDVRKRVRKLLNKYYYKDYGQ